MKAQKLLTLLATTALLVPTFSNGVNALEEVTQDISTQEVVTTHEETAPQTQEETTQPNPAPTLAKADRSLIPSAIIQSGTWGTAPWTFTDDGVLTIGAGAFGDVTANPWGTPGTREIERDAIQKIAFTGPVTFSTPDGAVALFWYLRNLTSITGLSNLDTSNCSDMRWMFINCSSLETLDVSSFDTSNVTDMPGMFSGCSSLTSLDLSKFDTSNVENMNAMFDGCSSLETLDLSTFDTSNVGDMGYMFSYCPSLTSLDLSKFDTSTVTDMQGMFLASSSLTALDLSSFDTSNVGDMGYMFSYCPSLTSLDLSKFDTSTVTDMQGMFLASSSLTALDLSSFDTSNVGCMIHMFSGCSSLTSLDLSKFDTSNVCDMVYMFSNCTSLQYLTLGENIRINGNTHLPDINTTSGKFTGQWVNLATGKSYKSSADFMANYDGSSPGTYEWAESKDPTPDAGGNTDKELKNKILDITKDYNLSNEAQNNIAKELEEKAKNGTLSLDDIKQIIQKYAPNLSASEQEELAEKLYKLLYPNSPLLPSTNETKQAGLTLLGGALLGLGITVFWIRRKRKV